MLKQSPTEIDSVCQTFYLSQGEKDLLLSAGVGEGLFFAGQSHVSIRVVAAQFEKELATSNPQEINEMQERNATPKPLSAPEGPSTSQVSPTNIADQSSPQQVNNLASLQQTVNNTDREQGLTPQPSIPPNQSDPPVTKTQEEKEFF